MKKLTDSQRLTNKKNQQKRTLLIRKKRYNEDSKYRQEIVASAKKRRHCNPEKTKQNDQKYYRKARLVRVKSNAKRRGIEFTITEKDIQWNTICPIFGIPLDYNAKGHAQYNSPSIDRIYNTKGYVPGNVHVVSFRANSLKKDATIEELETLVTWMKKCIT